MSLFRSVNEKSDTWTLINSNNFVVNDETSLWIGLRNGKTRSGIFESIKERSILWQSVANHSLDLKLKPLLFVLLIITELSVLKNVFDHLSHQWKEFLRLIFGFEAYSKKSGSQMVSDRPHITLYTVNLMF